MTLELHQNREGDATAQNIFRSLKLQGFLGERRSGGATIESLEICSVRFGRSLTLPSRTFAD